MKEAIATQTPQEIVLLYLTWMHIICWTLDVSSKFLQLFGKIMLAQFLMILKVCLYLVTMIYVQSFLMSDRGSDEPQDPTDP